jgi:sialate O-acetylesterase
MYNGMAATVIPYAIRGTLWYQGESNIHEGEPYFYKMKALIESWRKVWKQGDFPFYFCQLASYGNWIDPTGGDGWAQPREAQRQALTLKNTGMAVLCDIGNKHDVHPKNKFDVGTRLALWALAKDYGKKDLVYSGPLYKSVEFKDGKAIISFDHAKGLKAAKKKSPQDMGDPAPAGKLQGFSIAGPNKKFHWADAKIDGDKIILSSGRVKNPAAVRYIYTTSVHHGNLYNGANLPASPFLTDNNWQDRIPENKATAKLKPADRKPVASRPAAGAISGKADKLYRTALNAQRMGQREVAETFYSKIVKEYPGTPAAAMAAERLKKIGR